MSAIFFCINWLLAKGRPNCGLESTEKVVPLKQAAAGWPDLADKNARKQISDYTNGVCIYCHLSSVYCLAVSRQNSAAPSAPHAMPYLALFRQPNGPWTKEVQYRGGKIFRRTADMSVSNQSVLHF